MKFWCQQKYEKHKLLIVTINYYVKNTSILDLKMFRWIIYEEKSHIWTESINLCLNKSFGGKSMLYKQNYAIFYNFIFDDANQNFQSKEPQTLDNG